MNFVRRLSVCAQSPSYLLLHSVPERSRRHILNSHLGAWACRRHILNSHLGAWACRRHIISIALKSVHSIEHLWCSFGNSKTQSFQQISVNFVILKQIQKIYTQWLRELRSQTFSLCSTTNSSITRCLSVVEGTFSLLIPLPDPVEGRARKNWLFLFVLMLQFLFYSPPNFVLKSTNLFIHNSFKEM